MVVTPEEIAAAVQAASARGVYAAAHAHSAESIQACLDAGVRTIEHATWLTRDQCHAIKDAGEMPARFCAPIHRRVVYPMRSMRMLHKQT